ncbi:GNAT family N-acetyltransferase [Acinetobacter sp. B10A]|uniref:GNAT family N-acetyltransferase n=1 Tax=Acinetobacter baretiae TaxID=2605383 RepID=UPI001B3C62B0|nr:GNAT family N-acetyltransferase [Acinetobacter baretiae]MBF7685412.1 GNAT family N-acetyltransferase [Acinetobacter baretiae]
MVDHFRQIGVDEAQVYQQLVFHAYENIRALDIHFDAATMDVARAEQHLMQHLVYGLYRDDQLIATVTVRMPWGRLPGPFGLPHIGTVAVHSAYQGQGLSKLLLNLLEQKVLSTTLQTPAYSLGTASKHPWLFTMYQKLGFQEVKRADLGKGHITIFMLKVIDPTTFNHWNKKHQVVNYEN